MRMITNEPDKTINKLAVTKTLLLHGDNNHQVIADTGCGLFYTLRQVNTQMGADTISCAQWSWICVNSNNRVWDNFNTLQEALDYAIDNDNELYLFDNWKEAFQFMLKQVY